MVSGTKTESVYMPLRAHHIEMNRSRFSNARPIAIARENGRAQARKRLRSPDFAELC
jgi:hypothetical protein